MWAESLQLKILVDNHQILILLIMMIINSISIKMSDVNIVFCVLVKVQFESGLHNKRPAARGNCLFLKFGLDQASWLLDLPKSLWYTCLAHTAFEPAKKDNVRGM